MPYGIRKERLTAPGEEEPPGFRLDDSTLQPPYVLCPKDPTMDVRGDLHLIEKLNHVTRLPDGTWLSGYWKLSDFERSAVRRVYLHKTKADKAHFGGEVIRVFPATEVADLASRHDTDPTGRWVLVVRPEVGAKDAVWRGAYHAMAYKSLV